MKYKIERAPFSQPWTKIGAKSSADSCVGIMTSPDQNRYYAVKWNRQPLNEEKSVADYSLFLKKSIDLYEETLGAEFIVPTSIVTSSKMDGMRLRPKTFIIQPYIVGWTGQTLPDDLRGSDEIKSQWNTLYERLQTLYTSARSVNNQYETGSSKIFPINLTVGTSRRKALENVPLEDLPSTPNILIDRNLRIYLCDFGPYTSWDPEMETAYEQIRSLVKKRGGEQNMRNTIEETRPINANTFEYRFGGGRKPAVKAPETMSREVVQHLEGYTLKPNTPAPVRAEVMSHRAHIIRNI